MVAAEISIESLETANLRPMVDTARRELKAAGVTDKPGVVLADAGYWKNDAIEAIVNQGIQTLVAPDADKRKEPRLGRRGGLYDFTRIVLATGWGKAPYPQTPGHGRARLRTDQVEPGGQPLLTARQIRRQVGMAALTATHNLLKLHQHRLVAA